MNEQALKDRLAILRYPAVDSTIIRPPILQHPAMSANNLFYIPLCIYSFFNS